MDLDAFFVSAAITQNSKLANKPVVIAKNINKSVISSASYEARRLGVHSGMPIFMAKKIIHNLIVVDHDFELYSKLSNKVFKIVMNFSKNIEITSIDECYIKNNIEFKNINEAID